MIKFNYNQIKNIDTETWFVSLTFLMSAFPLLTYGMRSVILILWCAVGFLFFYVRKRANKETLQNDGLKNIPFGIYIIILPYFILILSLIISDDLSEGINKLIQMLALLIIPIVFFLNRT